MENNFYDNPWIIKCESFDSFGIDNKPPKQERPNFNHFNYLKNVPYLFRKIDDLIYCNICNILICKKTCLNHAKLHDQRDEDVDFIYTVSTKIENDYLSSDLNFNINTSKKCIIRSAQSKLSSQSKDKKRKCILDKSVKNKIEESIKCEEVSGNFLPKSTLNAENPLRIKIQLQPKLESMPKNGNIFENLQTFFPNTNLSKNITINVDKEKRMNIIDLTVSSPKKENGHVTKSHQFIATQKFHQRSQHDVYTDQTVNITGRPCIVTSVNNRNGPQYLTNSNQTYSVPKRNRVRSPQLAQLPQVFLTSKAEVSSGNIVPRKRVQVKGLCDALLPMKPSHSLKSFVNHLDDDQMSFQERLIDRKVFSKEDILRCKKPASVNNIGYSGQGRRLTNPSALNSAIRFVQNNSISSQSLSEIHSRLLNNGTVRTHFQKQSNQNVAVSNTLLRSRTMISNARNLSIHQNQSLELSDEEFYLDSTFINSIVTKTPYRSASSNNISYQYNQPVSELPTMSVSHSLNDINNINQKPSAPMEELLDIDVHYLPPPEETITSLSWEI